MCPMEDYINHHNTVFNQTFLIFKIKFYTESITYVIFSTVIIERFFSFEPWWFLPAINVLSIQMEHNESTQ